MLSSVGRVRQQPTTTTTTTMSPRRQPHGCTISKTLLSSATNFVAEDKSNGIPSYSTRIGNVVIDELNPSQREATLRPRYSITRVIAGPGAGKTRVLTCRIAHLLLEDNDMWRRGGSSTIRADGYRRRNGGEGILAVTFTKKSAGEMEHRLSELISSATKERMASSSLSDATERQGGSSSPGDEDKDCMQEGEVVQYYRNADSNDDTDNEDNGLSQQLMKQATVGTFHSVCSKVLRRFGKELGELPSVRECLGVTNAAGATVVQGGIRNGDDICNDNVSLTNKNVMVVPTLDGSFNILDQSDQLRLLKDILQIHNIELTSTASSGGANNEIRPITILNAISLLNTKYATKDTCTTRGGGNEDEHIANKMSKKVFKIAMHIRVPYQRVKYSQNSVDFDDLILLTRELLLHHPEVREILHRRWRHILVDEFQDTSQVQLDLVRLLTTNSLFVVGDGDQSIYSWRGASPESMSDFEVAFHDRANGWEKLLDNNQESLWTYIERISGGVVGWKEAVLKVKSVYLMENYRSTTNIVKAAQRIISTPEKSEKSNPTSAQDDIRRDMKPMRGDGPSPRVLACKDAKAEAQFVVQTVNSMVGSGDIKPSSTVAIIYRTNAQSRLLEEACVENNLRYVVRGSSGTFYKRAEIQDCMSFLKIMYNSRDKSAWARAVKAPSRGIGETSLNEFFRYCDAVTEKWVEKGYNREDMPTPLDMILSFTPPNSATPNDIAALISPKDILSTRSMNRFIPFASTLRSLRRKAEVQSVPDFLLSVIDDLDLKSHFNTLSKTRDEYEDRLGNVMELVRSAERYKVDGPCISFSSTDEPMEIPLGNFLDDVALIADIAPNDIGLEDGGRIVANLMTIHSSKGLEFDAVFLVGNEEGTFPTQRAITEGEGSIELSEERRLCYVAMTRAKTHLVLTWRREVSYFSGSGFNVKDGVRSRFLDTLLCKQGAAPSTERSNPSTQPRGNNLPLKNTSPVNKGIVVNSVTKREIHTEPKRLVASEGKSWSSWEPSSRQKAVRPVPSTVLRSNGVALRPNMTSNKTMKPSIKNSSDRRGIGTSPQRIRSRPNDNNPSRGVSPSSDTAQIMDMRRLMDTRQIQQSHQSCSPAVAVAKRPSQISKRSNVKATLHGEPPPDNMDSTLFFPVGSSVKHKLHGKGVVQAPPSTDSKFAEKMLVRVKFMEDHRGKTIESTEWDLPMNGLVHTYD